MNKDESPAFYSGLLPMLLALILVLAHFPGQLSAQNPPSQTVVTKKLPNGLTLAYIQDSSRKLFHISLTLRGGALLDNPEADGIAHLYEHLFFRRSDSLPEDSLIGPYAEKKGFLLHHSTHFESNFFALSLLPKQIPEGMGLLSTVLNYPTFDDQDLEKVRHEIAAEMQYAEAAPQYFLLQDLTMKLWGESAPNKNILGNYARLLALDADDIRAHFQPFLRPNRILIAATGAMDPESYFQLADSLFGYYLGSEGFGNSAYVAPPNLTENYFFSSMNAYADYPLLVFSWPTRGFENTEKELETAAFSSVSARLRGGAFYKALTASGKARELHWDYTPTWSPSALTLTVIPNPDSLRECVEAVHRELRKMRQVDYFSSSEYSAARNILRLEAAQRWDKSLPRLEDLGRRWAIRDPEWDAGKHPDANEKAVQRFVRKRLADRFHVAGLLLNSRYASGIEEEDLFSPPPREAFVASNETGSPAEKDSSSNIALNKIKSGVPPIDPEKIAGYRIYFKPNSVQPDNHSMLSLAEIANLMVENDSLRVYLNGFADGWGDGVTNYKLSIQRAQSVRDILQKTYGLNRKRLLIRPFGEAFPEYPDDTAVHRSLNRRVTLEVAPDKAIYNDRF